MDVKLRFGVLGFLCSLVMLSSWYLCNKLLEVHIRDIFVMHADASAFDAQSLQNASLVTWSPIGCNLQHMQVHQACNHCSLKHKTFHNFCDCWKAYTILESKSATSSVSRFSWTQPIPQRNRQPPQSKAIGSIDGWYDWIFDCANLSSRSFRIVRLASGGSCLCKITVCEGVKTGTSTHLLVEVYGTLRSSWSFSDHVIYTTVLELYYHKSFLSACISCWVT